MKDKTHNKVWRWAQQREWLMPHEQKPPFRTDRDPYRHQKITEIKELAVKPEETKEKVFCKGCWHRFTSGNKWNRCDHPSLITIEEENVSDTYLKPGYRLKTIHYPYCHQLNVNNNCKHWVSNWEGLKKWWWSH